MFGSLFHFSQRYFLIALVVSAIVAFVSYQLYLTQLRTVKTQELNQYQLYLGQTIDHLIKEKHKTVQALATALSVPLDFKAALINKDDSVRFKLKKFTLELKKFSAYKNVWIQLVDNQGVSIGRSWTNKRGDNLRNIRKDIAEIIRHPRRMDSFSVGKFALTFKSIVPLYDQKGKLLGMLDVISQVSSIDQSLYENEGVRSVVLVDKGYRKQLTKAFTQKFIGDFYVANIDARTEDMQLLERFGVEKLFKQQGVEIFDGQLITAKLVPDIYGAPMAVWVSMKPIEYFEFVGVENLQNITISVTIFFLISILLSMALLYFKQQADFEKRFFYQLFENSTEIIYIADRQKVIEANKQFFEFFNDITDLNDFHEKFDCVCDLFVEEKGYLGKYVNNEYWYDYVLKYSDINHLAKIQHNGETSIFQVKATSIENPFSKGEFVSILMTNITEEINYKNQLEHLIIHDELTGIYNRHFFNDALCNEISRAKRYKVPLSMMNFDIDHFKKINDEHGHDVGDKVLVHICKVIGQGLRETDHFCRLGGEEFCVLMPETDIEQAAKSAERMRLAVLEASYPDLPGAISISIGVVQLNQWDDDKTFYKRADIAMYQAKEQGRNCVVMLEG